MKLSEIKGERTIEVVADLIEPIAVISQNQNARELFTRKTVPTGMTSTEFFLQRVRASLPALLKECKDEIITVLATVKGVSAEEYASELNLATLIADVMELVSDQEFLSFFSSAVSVEEQESSGLPAESSEEAQ